VFRGRAPVSHFFFFFFFFFFFLFFYCEIELKFLATLGTSCISTSLPTHRADGKAKKPDQTVSSANFMAAEAPTSSNCEATDADAGSA